MSDEARRTVAVWPPEALHARPRLFATLAALLPVDFRAADGRPSAAVVAVGEPPGGLVAGGGASFVATVGSGKATKEEHVRVSDADAVDRRLHGIELVGALGEPWRRDDDEVLASSPSGPAWSRRRAGPHHRVRAELTELPPGEVLRNVLLYRRPLAPVALICFLRELVAGDGWEPPPLRASIVFDDPNLRRPGYGFIDYRRLLEHADEHGYHVAMAMIPLDAGRPHPEAAALFAQRPDRLSLVFHGNDHVRRELMAPADPVAARAMAAQALRRMARFERRASLRVDRVMVPPHGTCSEVTTAALAALGFDALCAIHPLPWTERPPEDALLTGCLPAQFVNGCAVIPRFPFTTADDEIALRAFLDQPLVWYGHHDDVAGGLEPLAHAAAVARRLGVAEWSPLGALAAGNHSLRRDGGRLVVRPHARRVRMRVPRDANAVEVRRPPDAGRLAELSAWSLDGGEPLRFGEAAPMTGAGAVEIRLHGPEDVNAAAVPPPALRPWRRVRRAATEARDRALPLRAL